MLARIKQLFCNHESIDTKSEVGLNAVEKGYFIVKTLISCNKCKKSFQQHPHAMCCYVMHMQHEMIKEAIFNNGINQIKSAKQ